MSRYILTVLLVWLIGLGLCAGQAGAVLLYQNHYNDMTDVTVINKDVADVVEISSDRSVDLGGTSLKFTDVVQPGAVTSTGITDETTTWIASLYITGDYSDHANFSIGSPTRAVGPYVLRGYPTVGNLGAVVNGGDLINTGVFYPVDQWVTIGMVVNGLAGTYDLYFAPGTTLTPADKILTGAEMYHEASVWNALNVSSGNAAPSGPMYLDELRVYSELGEGIVPVPEPSSALLSVAGLFSLLSVEIRRRKK